MTSPASHNRYAFLDVCRALAAIAVMLQHAGEAAGLFGLKTTDFSHSVFSFGQMGVVLFFLISGYIIPKSLESAGNMKRFWVRRIFRIYPLYFFIMAVTIIISIVFQHKPAPEPLILLPHLVFVQSWIGFPNYVGGSWTLFIELLWYSLFATIFFLKINRNHFLVFYAPMAGIIALEVLSTALNIRFPFGRFCMIAACFMGLLWLRYNDGVVSKRFFFTTLAAYGATLLSAFYVGFELIPAARDDAFTFQGVIITWAVGIATFALAYWLRFESRILAYLGMISFSVYLVHSPVITVLHALGVTGPLVLPAVFAITIPISVLTYKYVEEVFVNLSRKVS